MIVKSEICKKESLLLLSALLLFLFLAAFHDVWVLLPYLLDVLVVVLFRAFEGRRQQLDDLSMLVPVGPVGCVVTILITLILIDVLGDKLFDQVSVTFTCRDVQAGEPLLVFDLGVAAIRQEDVDHVLHVELSSQVHRCVTSDSLVVINVDLGAVLE